MAAADSSPSQVRRNVMAKARPLEHSKVVPMLDTPTDLSPEARREISGALNVVLADTFALYLKTKNFHWHVSGPHFRDYHLLLDEQAARIFAMTDAIAERLSKIGGTASRWLAQTSNRPREVGNDRSF